MTLRKLSPAEARALVEKGAVLVDVREKGERRRGHIPGSLSMPLSKLGPLSDEAAGAEAVVFYCRSGMRTSLNAANLARTTDCDAFVLDGGIARWAAAGLPIEREASVPPTPELRASIERQSRAVAGLLVLAGLALGYTVAPVWYAVAALGGGAAALDAATGRNPLQNVVAALPWNEA